MSTNITFPYIPPGMTIAGCMVNPPLQFPRQIVYDKTGTYVVDNQELDHLPMGGDNVIIRDTSGEIEDSIYLSFLEERVGNLEPRPPGFEDEDV